MLQGESPQGTGLGKGGKNEKEGRTGLPAAVGYSATEGGASQHFAAIPSLQFSVEAIPRAELEHKKGENRKPPLSGHILQACSS